MANKVDMDTFDKPKPYWAGMNKGKKQAPQSPILVPHFNSYVCGFCLSRPPAQTIATTRGTPSTEASRSCSTSLPTSMPARLTRSRCASTLRHHASSPSTPPPTYSLWLRTSYSAGQEAAHRQRRRGHRVLRGQRAAQARLWRLHPYVPPRSGRPFVINPNLNLNLAVLCTRRRLRRGAAQQGQVSHQLQVPACHLLDPVRVGGAGSDEAGGAPRLSMNYKREVEPPTPELPETGVLSKSSYFREFLLTKRTRPARFVPRDE